MILQLILGLGIHFLGLFGAQTAVGNLARHAPIHLHAIGAELIGWAILRKSIGRATEPGLTGQRT
jgi:hypothetical protein